MVRDGIYYGLAFILVAALVGWLTLPVLGIIPLLLAAFFLWFFRDPERRIPAIQGAIVSPADGKVTDISVSQVDGEPHTRISIFLNVFNVHVNRSPVSGVIEEVRYQKGKFGNAMGAVSADENEQNIVTLRSDAGVVVFKQIAGLLARRIVFTKKVGDRLERGERVGSDQVWFAYGCNLSCACRYEGARGRHREGRLVGAGDRAAGAAAGPRS